MNNFDYLNVSVLIKTEKSKEAMLAFHVLILIQASLTKNVKGIRASCASLFTRVLPEVNSGLKKINHDPSSDLRNHKAIFIYLTYLTSS